MLWEGFKRSEVGSRGGLDQNALYISTMFSKNDFLKREYHGQVTYIFQTTLRTCLLWTLNIILP